MLVGKHGENVGVSLDVRREVGDGILGERVGLHAVGIGRQSERRYSGRREGVAPEPPVENEHSGALQPHDHTLGSSQVVGEELDGLWRCNAV